jgi:hypothetical protein
LSSGARRRRIFFLFFPGQLLALLEEIGFRGFGVGAG